MLTARLIDGNVLAGARTAGLVCALVQLGYNELGVTRIKFVTRKIEEAAMPAPAPAIPEATETPKMTFFDHALSLIGFRKLSEEEYVKVLKKQRDEALERIAILERERAEEQARESTTEASPDTA